MNLVIWFIRFFYLLILIFENLCECEISCRAKCFMNNCDDKYLFKFKSVESLYTIINSFSTWLIYLIKIWIEIGIFFNIKVNVYSQISVILHMCFGFNMRRFSINVHILFTFFTAKPILIFFCSSDCKWDTYLLIIYLFQLVDNSIGYLLQDGCG